jgi:hypothetical protein
LEGMKMKKFEEGKKYSKVYLSKDEKYFGFRYNYTDSVLEYVSRWDFRKIDGKYQDVMLEDWEVVSNIGLSRESWKENPQYWIDTYQDELDEECAYLAKHDGWM